jgi:phosphoribosylformylglycinamidine (FGAM) synthase-like amidotransferase family enzyme
MLNKTVAFLWDESFLWGLIAYKALKTTGLPFDLMRSEDIKRGQLKNYKMLFVPGGWASNKIKTLGKEGISEIKKFVNSGGNYLGFCGGAGLATLDGIGLLNIKRMPTKQRVPSFSGRIELNINEHPIWNSSLHHSITPSTVFHAWWPSQFLTPPWQGGE